MAAWCAEHLRDVEEWKAIGCHFSTSDEATKLFDGLLRQMVSYNNCEQLGGFGKTLENLLAADSDGIMTRAFKCTLDVLGTQTSSRVNEQVAKNIDQLDIDAQQRGTEWEKKHVKAVKFWGEGHWAKAQDIWNKLVDENPYDFYALKLAHDGCFFRGDNTGVSIFMDKVLPKWNQSMPMYSHLFGMYAFGLEENGQYAKAEESAKKALALNLNDPWSIHARVHVMEMSGRFDEGIKFLEDTKSYWNPSFLGNHTNWHHALYNIERGELETALTIFDDEVLTRTKHGAFVLDHADAASLLMRLELQGVNVGDRWKELPSMESHIFDHITGLNDCHILAGFHKIGELETVEKMHESLINFTKCNDSAKVNEIVGLNLFEGVSAFCNEKYDEAVEKIYPVRKEIYRIGGSNAQRDLFTQILIESCIQSEEKENWRLAIPLLEERAELRSGEMPVSERLAMRFRNKHCE